MKSKIISIAAGKAKEYKTKQSSFQSAYKKDQFFDSIKVDKLGLVDDEQFDTRFHGGLDKAIHIGSYKHLLNNTDFDKLSIGCNILVDNVSEDDINIGDIYTIGYVEVEVCQPRQPCWKIGALFGKDVSRYISNNQATGWYVRVLKEGLINKTDEMVLKKRVSDITIKELSSYLKRPPEDREIIDEIISSSYIADSYKKDFLSLMTDV